MTFGLDQGINTASSFPNLALITTAPLRSSPFLQSDNSSNSSSLKLGQLILLEALRSSFSSARRDTTIATALQYFSSDPPSPHLLFFITKPYFGYCFHNVNPYNEQRCGREYGLRGHCFSQNPLQLYPQQRDCEGCLQAVQESARQM